MSDIPSKLRAWAPLIASGYECPAASTAMLEAADEIMRLRAAAKRHRWNIEEDGSDLLICDALHEKDEKCEFVRYVRAALGEPTTQPMEARRGELRTICDDCGNSNLAHDRAVWTDDGASYCPTCRTITPQPMEKVKG